MDRAVLRFIFQTFKKQIIIKQTLEHQFQLINITDLSVEQNLN